jgi:hypothetical protein
MRFIGILFFEWLRVRGIGDDFINVPRLSIDQVEVSGFEDGLVFI